MSKNIHNYKGSLIVYVDDEQDNLTGFEMNLEDHFDLKTFSDPTLALEFVKTNDQVTVLIVDQVMPKKTGLELAREAKKFKPYLPCLMLTGNGTKQLAMDAIKQGVFWDFWEKPIDFSSIQVREKIVAAIGEFMLGKTRVDYRQGTLELLATLIDDKDGHTHKHSERVTEWALKIGQQMNLSEIDLLVLREGALIHDIGKISIPDDILKKPGKLSALERKVIMSHPGRGGDIVANIPQLSELVSMVRDHHERPDGQGYPKGLKEDEIPLHTSIVAVADFFEALSAHRPYKEPWVIQDIVKELLKCRGSQFKSEVVDALLEVIKSEGLLHEADIENTRKTLAA